MIIQVIKNNKNQSKIRIKFLDVSNNCDQVKVNTDSSPLKKL